MEIERRALEGQKETLKEASKYLEGFLICTSKYAFKNAKALVSASEIAEGAIMECQVDLIYYEMQMSSYHRTNILLSNSELYFERGVEMGRDRARIDVQELIELGKRNVINILIKVRQ